MRKILAFLTLFTLSLTNAYGQDFGFIGLGYNASFVAPEQLNYVIGRYNSTRNFLSTPMKEMKLMQGLAFDFQRAGDRLIVNLNFTTRGARLFAEGDNGSGLTRREVKFSANNFGFGLGVSVLNEWPFYLAIGGDFNTGIQRVKTRVAPAGEIKEAEYVKVLNTYSLGVTLWGQFIIPFGDDTSPAIVVRPYYYVDFVESNFANLNQEINPTTYLNDSQDLRDKYNHFGIQILATVFSGN